MVTIKDIADKLGISISTVSKGLNNASDISEETRQQVLDTAVELGYIRKKKKMQPFKKVCVLVENIDYENINQFGYEIITGFRMIAAENHYQVDVIPLDIETQYRQPYEAMMNRNDYCGAFILGLTTEDAYMSHLETTNIPTVLFDSQVSNPKVGHIGTNNYEGIMQGVRHVYDYGHRKIGFLNGRSTSMVARERNDAFLRAMSLLDLTVDPDTILYAGFSPEIAKDAAKIFLDKETTAIICTSDYTASGIITELYRNGRRVPEDISVIGYNDLPIAKYLAPPLTTIRQDRAGLGRCAFILLNNLIHGLSISAITLHPQLIIRDSVAQLKKPNP